MGIKQAKIFIFKFANKFYKNFFSIYKPLYFFYKRISDRKKIAFLESVVKPGMTIVDIGANIGFYTLFFSKLAGPEGKVYAFEPDEINFKHLLAITAGCKNVVAVKKAVGDFTGEIKLYASEDLNVDHQAYDSGEGRKTIMVDSIALDDYFDENDKIDLIKIDIQGYDFNALKGAKKTIRRQKDLLFLGEFWPYGLKKAGSSSSEYFGLLKELDFKVKFDEYDSDYDAKADDKNFYTDFIAGKTVKVAE